MDVDCIRKLFDVAKIKFMYILNHPVHRRTVRADRTVAERS